MIVNVSIVGGQETIAKFRRMGAAIEAALYVKTLTLALKLEKKVKTEKLNGQVLNRRTGALARSIHNKVEKTQAGVVGRVFSSGDVKYAGIHEYGGTIKHPGGTRYFIKGNGMAQFVSNKNAFAMLMPKTAPHDIKMPMRSFLRSSLREMSKEISVEYKKSIVETAQKVMKG